MRAVLSNVWRIVRVLSNRALDWLLDPVVLVPLVLAALLLVSAASETVVELLAVGSTTIRAPLWVVELLVLLVLAVVLALVAYALGDDE
jgi:hypothetical protein